MAIEVCEKPLYLTQDISRSYLQPEIRGLFSGAFAQGIFSFAQKLPELAYEEGNNKMISYLSQDALTLYDFLIIAALQPQTVRVGRAYERVSKKGGRFTNLRFHYYDQGDAQMEVSLSEEPRRRKIEANLIRSARWRRAPVKDFPYIGISVTAWASVPVDTEVALGQPIGTERFFPLPYARVRRDHFQDSFDGLLALYEQVS